MAAQCNTLFCILGRHDDDMHMDVTWHVWHEPLSPRPVIARVYYLSDQEPLAPNEKPPDPPCVA